MLHLSLEIMLELLAQMSLRRIRNCLFLILFQVNGFGGIDGVGAAQLLSPGVFHSPAGYELAAGDIMADIQNQMNELSLSDSDGNQPGRYRTAKKPPSTYLCHLCFQKGHFIKDCPQVLYLLPIMLLSLMIPHLITVVIDLIKLKRAVFQ